MHCEIKITKTMDGINTKILEVMQAKGINRKELASKLGCTQQNLSLFINGNPRIGTLERLSATIGCELKDLII